MIKINKSWDLIRGQKKYIYIYNLRQAPYLKISGVFSCDWNHEPGMLVKITVGQEIYHRDSSTKLWRLARDLKLKDGVLCLEAQQFQTHFFRTITSTIFTSCLITWVRETNMLVWNCLPALLFLLLYIPFVESIYYYGYLSHQPNQLVFPRLAMFLHAPCVVTSTWLQLYRILEYIYYIYNIVV